MKISVILQKEKDAEPIQPIEYQVGEGTEELLSRIVGDAVKEWIKSGFRSIEIKIDPEK